MIETIKEILFVALAGFVVPFCGCMGEREYQLRKIQIDALAKHPKTYHVVTIEGPLELKQGAKITADSPTQPLSLPAVPDGQAMQQAVIRDAITGAIIGYGINRAAAKTNHNTNTTTVNNAGGQQ